MTEVLAEYSFVEDLNGLLWINVRVNRQPYDVIGPFKTPGERERALDDLLSIQRAAGAIDLPERPQ